jgi:hypothetical protein
MEMAVGTNGAAADQDLELKIIQAAVDLQERGWTVVEGVLSKADCDEYIHGLWDFLEGLGTGVKRDDPATWGPEHFPPTYRGILNTLEVGHHAFVWKVRKNPRLVKVFERLWGTNELLTSFDAINILGPHNEAPAPGWLHVDQKPTTPHLACIQGIMNLTQVGPDITGTLMVKDKSYKAHQDFFWKASNLSTEQLNEIPDHYQFTAEQLPYWDQFDSIGLSGGPGSLFLWDSRTVHSNTAPPVLKQWRHVVYCCYQPRSMASERDLHLKAKGWNNRMLTTHLPAADIRIYDEDFAKRYANEAKVMNVENMPAFQVHCDRDTVEDSTVRRLAGVEPYPEAEIRRARPLMQMPTQELQEMLGQGNGSMREAEVSVSSQPQSREKSLTVALAHPQQLLRRHSTSRRLRGVVPIIRQKSGRPSPWCRCPLRSPRPCLQRMAL